MSITSAIPYVSTVLNAVKSITIDDCKLEEKQKEEDIVCLKQDNTCYIDEEQRLNDQEEDLNESEEPEASHSDYDYDPQNDEEQGLSDEEEDVQQYTAESTKESDEDDTDNEEENEDYSPNDDPFDYSQDVEDDTFVSEWVADADILRIDGESVQSEPEQLNTDHEVFRKEFEQALCNVRAVAKVDQERLIDSICGISAELLGTIPDSKQIAVIFGRIKDELAAEAKEEMGDDVTDDDDDEDEDYSPNDDPFDYSQDVEEYISEQDEEDENDGFATEYTSAIDHIVKIAKIERQNMLRNVKAEYKRETGEEATDGMIADAFDVFRIDGESAQIEAEQLNIDPQVFRKEFEEALCNVRAVAKMDQERLIDSICGISAELCGTIPDPKQISEIFGRIKDELAAEAKEDFLAFNEITDDDEDENEEYSPNDDPFDYSQDVEEDKFGTEEDVEEDVEEEEEDNVEDEEERE